MEKFIYLRDPKNEKRVMTIRYVPDSEAWHPWHPVGDSWLMVTTAITNPDGGDRFCKKIGRAITRGRATAPSHNVRERHFICVDKVRDLDVVVNLPTNDLTSTERRIVRHWLKTPRTPKLTVPQGFPENTTMIPKWLVISPIQALPPAAESKWLIKKDDETGEAEVLF